MEYQTINIKNLECHKCHKIICTCWETEEQKWTLEGIEKPENIQKEMYYKNRNTTKNDPIKTHIKQIQQQTGEEYLRKEITYQEYKNKLEQIKQRTQTLYEEKKRMIETIQNEINPQLRNDSEQQLDLLEDLTQLTQEHNQETQTIPEGIHISIWHNNQYLGLLTNQNNIITIPNIKEAFLELSRLRNKEDGFEYYLENINIQHINDLNNTEEEQEKEAIYLSDRVTYDMNMRYKLEKGIIEEEEYYRETAEIWQ